MLNSPTERVTTISEPATMPPRQLGRTTPKNRWRALAPRLAALSSRVRRSMADQHGEDRPHHEREREEHVTDQDEEPGGPELSERAIGDDEREGGGQSGDRHRHHQQLLEGSRQPVLAPRQRVGGGNAEHQGHGQAGQRDPDGAKDGVAVAGPHLGHPAQGEPAAGSDEVVLGQSGQDRHSHGDDQEGAHEEREGELKSEAQATPAHLRRPPPRWRRRRSGPWPAPARSGRRGRRRAPRRPRCSPGA